MYIYNIGVCCFNIRLEKNKRLCSEVIIMPMWSCCIDARGLSSIGNGFNSVPPPFVSAFNLQETKKSTIECSLYYLSIKYFPELLQEFYVCCLEVFARRILYAHGLKSL